MKLTLLLPQNTHLFDPSHVPILQKFRNFTVKSEFHYLFIKNIRQCQTPETIMATTQCSMKFLSCFTQEDFKLQGINHFSG